MFELEVYPEGGGKRSLQKVNSFLPDYTTHPRSQLIFILATTVISSFAQVV
jgi:hypothetical protein